MAIQSVYIRTLKEYIILGKSREIDICKLLM